LDVAVDDILIEALETLVNERVATALQFPQVDLLVLDEKVDAF
jgi:hypothetical protein